MSVKKSLSKIQRSLKVPKTEINAFGKYKFRKAEQILEAVKPLLGENESITINDDIVLIGDRYYVKATALLNVGDESIASVAFARESLDKKGMDSAQVTGATSSYARKYALNGLLAIDDTKDPDETNTHDDQSSQSQEPRPSQKQMDLINMLNKRVKNPRPSEKINSIQNSKQASGVIEVLKAELGE